MNRADSLAAFVVQVLATVTSDTTAGVGRHVGTYRHGQGVCLPPGLLLPLEFDRQVVSLETIRPFIISDPKLTQKEVAIASISRIPHTEPPLPWTAA